MYKRQPLRHAVGLDRIMWGSDYPHREASFPYSREALRLAYTGVEPTEVQAMIGGNAAALYGFDFHELTKVGARIGPTIEEIATPIAPEDIPAEAVKCPAFASQPIGATAAK